MLEYGGRRGEIRWSDQTLLPLRPIKQFSGTVSCWYCDFKFSALNEPLFRFGRRHSRSLRAWFSIGVVFSLAALLGVTLIILCELVRTTLVFAGNTSTGNSLFGLGSVIGGLHISLPNMVYLCLSSVICVFVHELGHALAAASEGVHVEYVAIFLAVLFPGALVAFNHSSLQALPVVASLRIYCAGIWHNAAFCVGCALALVLLPFIFSPFYIHGESLMVLDVPSMSPLYGYLSRHDVIFSLDGIRIHTTEEWKQTITMLTEQTYSLNSDQPSVNLNVENGYCIHQSLTKEIAQVQFKGNQTYCPNELIAFASMTCLDVEKYTNNANRNNHQRRENIHCLDAKDVIKLKKCAYPNFKEQALTNGSSCLCSEVESCLAPMQLPGLGWVEITYSSLECHSRRRSLFSPEKHSSSEQISCLQTFVYVGDLITMANSIHLTSYQPRWTIYFMAYLPNLLEKLFTYAFHVSMVLALLNSLPVFFLDGEYILEATLHCFGSLNSRMKQSVRRCCLLVGTSFSACFILQTIFVSVS
ncbi:hypothetical protein ACP275_13G205000 [Erythranthe tilingii]